MCDVIQPVVQQQRRIALAPMTAMPASKPFCSSSMPIDCEYLLSVSPPIFNGNSFKKYSNCDPFAAFGQPFQRKSIDSFSYSNFNVLKKNERNKLKNLLPLRSCLIARSEDINELKKSVGKKRVVFADDKGFALTAVKVLVEPSDCPPLWDNSFLEQVTRGIKAEASPVTDVWEPDFEQPAANYLQFRNKLDSNCVSLENVIVKDDDRGQPVISGTVKVKNIEFHKSVIFRVSFDQWKSHKDFNCSFVPSSVDPELIVRHDLYDTFSFTVRLPDMFLNPSHSSKSVEFCVQYICGDGSQGPVREFWDSNKGRNYRLYSSGPNTPDHQFTKDHTQKQFEDALTAELNSWTEFASWHHLINDTPYY